MDVAISKGDFHKAERLNKELYNIHIAKAVQDASAKASYEMERLVGISDRYQGRKRKISRNLCWIGSGE